MGAPTVRITRDEFLTPPEFHGPAARSHPAARVGGARIELVRRGAETRLGTCYQQVPVRLMPPFVFDGEPAALLYLINLTAGLMDGDAHRFDIHAGPDTRAVITGQSATRVHPSLVDFSTQQWQVEVATGGCLVVLPGPLIPFRGCRYFQRARAELAPAARLIWGDIWLPGRYERGALSEKFQFDRIVQDLEVRRAGRLVYRDRYCWDGPWSAEEAFWHFGDNLCSASLFVSGPVAEPADGAASGVQRAWFPLDSGDACVRWCGPPELVTADLVRTALLLAANCGQHCECRPWLLESSNLGPNHWFMPASEPGLGPESAQPAGSPAANPT